MTARQTMSMEAALDEERVAVLELMEGRKPAPPARHRGSSASLGTAPPLLRGSSPATSPRSPVRSMLDIDDTSSIPRHASIAGTSASGISQPVRSMLDIGPTSPRKHSIDKTRSTNTSPTETASTTPQPHNRSSSDAVSQPPPNFGPRGPGKHNGDITDDYQFSGYLQSNPGGPVAPKRNTLAGRKPAGNAMADAMGGNLGAHPKDRGRSLGSLGVNIPKSRSPHTRVGPQSASTASTNSNMLVMDSGLMLDKDSAYRRLSDANLALAGGNFTNLAHRKKSDADSRGRLTKDYSYTEEGVVESSDDESDEENHRGRKPRPSTDDDVKSPTGSRAPKSLMAAAEEERQNLVEEQQKKAYQYRSLLDPEIEVTAPGGEKVNVKLVGKGKGGTVHPSNAFDLGGPSGVNTPRESEEEMQEEISDIRRAQRLAILLTPIQSRPETQRSVRTIFRGDFAKMQRDARDEGRRNRKYLVATDLSEEAAHALEWTVGTVLRDGDTLLAIYCVDEDTGITSEGPTPSIERQAEAAAASVTSLQPTTAKSGLRHSITAASGVAGALGVGSPRGGGTPRGGNSATPAMRGASVAELERWRAVEDITERVSRLLRKTKLQVRVVVEVIQCKSPKHLLCEIIDYFEPTMVVLGSRGRSALKGVILGSFSNYLVTKSSVPVMVARKRLRKHVKYGGKVKLANNLGGLSSKTLASAKID